MKTLDYEDHCLRCPNCGYQTQIDPALIRPDDPMLYCPECDEPLIQNKTENE